MKKRKILQLTLSLFLILGIPGFAFANAIKPWGVITDSQKRFVILPEFNDEAVLDRVTGLIWMRSPSLPASNGRNWGVAQDLCLRTTHIGAIFSSDGAKPGYGGWRLPKIEELGSLVSTRCFSGHGCNADLAPGHPFTNINTAFPVWSATEAPHDSSRAYAFWPTPQVDSKTDTFGVWCVRGGSH